MRISIFITNDRAQIEFAAFLLTSANMRCPVVSHSIQIEYCTANRV